MVILQVVTINRCKYCAPWTPFMWLHGIHNFMGCIHHFAWTVNICGSFGWNFWMKQLSQWGTDEVQCPLTTVLDSPLLRAKGWPRGKVSGCVERAGLLDMSYDQQSCFFRLINYEQLNLFVFVHRLIPCKIPWASILGQLVSPVGFGLSINCVPQEMADSPRQKTTSWCHFRTGATWRAQFMVSPTGLPQYSSKYSSQYSSKYSSNLFISIP